MFFLQITKAPIQVTIGDRVFSVPKLTIADLSVWGSIIKAAKISEATAGMDDARRQEYLTFYDIPMPDINAFRKLTVTVDGSGYILSTQLAKATIADGTRLLPEEIQTVIEAMPHGTRAELAWAIADMADTSSRNVSDKGTKASTNP